MYFVWHFECNYNFFLIYKFVFLYNFQFFLFCVHIIRIWIFSQEWLYFIEQSWCIITHEFVVNPPFCTHIFPPDFCFIVIIIFLYLRWCQIHLCMYNYLFISLVYLILSSQHIFSSVCFLNIPIYFILWKKYFQDYNVSVGIIYSYIFKTLTWFIPFYYAYVLYKCLFFNQIPMRLFIYFLNIVLHN